MSPILISAVAFVGVACIVAAVAMLFRGDSENKVEDRLDLLAGLKSSGQKEGSLLKESVLSQPLDAMPGMFDAMLSRLGRWELIFQQADTSLTPTKFLAVSGGMGVAGTLLCLVGGLNIMVAPLAGLGLAFVPMAWLLWRRKRRLKKFSAQLSDALELISRALRAGHSLAAGFDLVQSEMMPPISTEFGRVFEEQNLGIPMEEALESLTDRVPNLDLKFFSTAIILQRTTGGDLAEILDKISHLIRERFKIYGQVQALTGEGRLSGIVLLALPPVLFLAVYRLNPNYIMLLFNDPLGTKMLAGGVILQVLGALVIRKIINIKV
jgi:tight adherence protein B